MFDLSGRRALVTGASGGIGQAIAEALHGNGATVALTGTRTAVLEALAARLGERACAVPADLATPQGAEALVKAAEAQLGGIDILVNNAGVTRDGLLVRMKDED
ncbi:MAG: SDR family NAD(P)-dependent oxidoreductase, partial [Proteobacteria bacterium]|nr:SDR family NAD(P)-dependent oxidoreductase [Pseudomonadota bacterium]